MRDEGGQAVVEFALVLPLLLAVVYAIVSFGQVYENSIALTEAVRAGARVALVSRTAVDPTGTATAAVVSSGGNLGLTPGQVSVTSTWQPGSDVTVSATYPYSVSLFGMSLVAGNLNSSTTVRVE